jgi:DNA polymerase (family 10)
MKPPDNAEIAVALDTIADLLELKAGTNPWRVRAYRNAVKTIERLGKPIHEMVTRGDDLTQLAGIGSEMAKHIGEIVTGGRSTLLDKLAEDTPVTLIELAKVKGIGLKKGRVLHDELGIKTLDELERAIEIGWL